MSDESGSSVWSNTKHTEQFNHFGGFKNVWLFAIELRTVVVLTLVGINTLIGWKIWKTVCVLLSRSVKLSMK